MADDEVDHEVAFRLVRDGVILPLERLMALHPSLQGVQLLEVELEQHHGQYRYELEFLAADGQVWEWRLDAATGTVLERKQED
ncbi:MAG: PepSY domain-containing protein [Magnetococcales bacterium]|nr:PepSY domain-containing protein [Magnetococcales bacterium]